MYPERSTFISQARHSAWWLEPAHSSYGPGRQLLVSTEGLTFLGMLEENLRHWVDPAARGFDDQPVGEGIRRVQGRWTTTLARALYARLQRLGVDAEMLREIQQEMRWRGVGIPSLQGAAFVVRGTYIPLTGQRFGRPIQDYGFVANTIGFVWEQPVPVPVGRPMPLDIRLLPREDYALSE